MEDYILEIKNALPGSLCREIIKRFEMDNRKYPGVTGSGVMDIKKSTDLVISGLVEWDDIHKELGMSLNYNYSKYYIPRIINLHDDTNWWGDYQKERTLDINGSSGFQIQCTKKGEYYGWHDDSFENRRLTYIFYLNTMEEEDGGVTEFYNGKIIKPEQGKLLIFPATWTYPHRGTEVTGKNKYIITGWFAHVDPYKLKKY